MNEDEIKNPLILISTIMQQMMWKTIKESVINWFHKILGFYRLNQSYICQYDYHDYPDSEENQPMHFYTYKCKHCGQEFHI